MKKKLSLFLFALGLSASYAFASGDPCMDTCLLKYNDCLTKPWLPAGYCNMRFQNCIAACDGTPPGQ